MSKLIDYFIKYKSSHLEHKINISNHVRAKSFLEFKLILKRETINVFLILVGVCSSSFGLKSFLLPNSFIDGGITGVSLLISKLGAINLPILIIVLNIPFIFMGYRQIGKSFVIKT